MHICTRMSRRHFVTAGAALALLTLLPLPARAFSIEDSSPALPELPPVDGALAWDDLRAGAVGAHLGQEVTVAGYMLPLEDTADTTRFVLAPYAAHCAACSPGGTAARVEVAAAGPVAFIGQRRIMRGRLEAAAASDTGLAGYTLHNARIA